MPLKLKAKDLQQHLAILRNVREKKKLLIIFLSRSQIPLKTLHMKPNIKVPYPNPNFEY